MKYRYIEFTDEVSRSAKNGKIIYVGNPSDALICELGLETDHPDSSSEYSTTIQDLGEKGWELQFVTPCGFYSGSTIVRGPIINSYIFKKTVD